MEVDGDSNWLTSRSIQRWITLQFEFELPSPPWMSYTFGNRMKKHKLGITGWFDMCVDDPLMISDFYHKVIGWMPESFKDSPGSATHFFMKDGHGRDQVGICDMKEFEPWATGWVPYINVDDYDGIVSRSRELGGQVIAESIFGCTIPDQRVALIRDPSGASVMICEIPEHLIDREPT